MKNIPASSKADFSEIVLDMLQNMSEEFLLEKNVIRLYNCKIEKFAFVSKK